MNTQILSSLRWLINVLYAWFSDRQRMRFVLTAVVLCLVVAALLIPALSAGAAGIPGGINH